MNRLDRLILPEIVGPFVFAALLFTGLFFAAGEFARVLEYAQRGVPTPVILQVLWLTMPSIIGFTFPMATLLAALLGFTRLSKDFEVIAITAAGVPFARVVAPVAVFALLVSLLGLWLNDSLVPNANRGRQKLIDDLKTQAGQTVFTTGAFDLPIRRNGELSLQLHVEGGVDLGSGTLRKVAISFWNKGVVTAFFYADRAEWKIDSRDWTLTDFHGAYFTGKTRVLIFGKKGQTQEIKDLGTPEELAALQRPALEVTSSVLRERAQILRKGGDEMGARDVEIEIARRFAMPFSSLIFALIGAPLGVVPPRQGSGSGFTISIFISFAYWISLTLMNSVARSGVMPPLLAMSLPNIAGFFIGLYLIRRVLR